MGPCMHCVSNAVQEWCGRIFSGTQFLHLRFHRYRSHHYLRMQKWCLLTFCLFILITLLQHLKRLKIGQYRKIKFHTAKVEHPRCSGTLSCLVACFPCRFFGTHERHSPYDMTINSMALWIIQINQACKWSSVLKYPCTKQREAIFKATLSSSVYAI